MPAIQSKSNPNIASIMRSLLSLPKAWHRSDGTNPAPSPSEQLRERLQSAQVSCQLNAAASFIPIRDIYALVRPGTVQSILEELDSYPSGSRENLSATIVQRAPRLFALLVWIGQARLVLHLELRYFDDSRLPLSTHEVEMSKLRAI